MIRLLKATLSQNQKADSKLSNTRYGNLLISLIKLISFSDFIPAKFEI